MQNRNIVRILLIIVPICCCKYFEKDYEYQIFKEKIDKNRVVLEATADDYCNQRKIYCISLLDKNKKTFFIEGYKCTSININLMDMLKHSDNIEFNIWMNGNHRPPVRSDLSWFEKQHNLSVDELYKWLSFLYENEIDYMRTEKESVYFEIDRKRDHSSGLIYVPEKYIELFAKRFKNGYFHSTKKLKKIDDQWYYYCY